MRSFSLVLLRRLLFRSPANGRLALYDHLPAQALASLERFLLYSLLHEPSVPVRRKSVDTITDLANYSMSRGNPWHALQAQAFAMAQGENPNNREAAYRVFAGSPNLIMDLQADSVLAVLQKGLQDPQSVEVSFLHCLKSRGYACIPHIRYAFQSRHMEARLSSCVNGCCPGYDQATCTTTIGEHYDAIFPRCQCTAPGEMPHSSLDVSPPLVLQ